MWAVAVEALARRIVELQDTVQTVNDDRERLRLLSAELDRQATVQRKAAAQAISDRDHEASRATAEKERLEHELDRLAEANSQAEEAIAGLNVELDRERQKNGEAEETIANLRYAVKQAEADLHREQAEGAQWQKLYEAERAAQAERAGDALRVAPADLWQLTNELARVRGVTTAHVSVEHIKARNGRVLGYGLWEDGTHLGLLPRRVYEGVRDIDIRTEREKSLSEPTNEALAAELAQVCDGTRTYHVTDDTGAYTLTKRDA
jgi:hypothetical protein